jgi:ATP synthase protein I
MTEDSGGDRRSFEERLQTARDRRGLAPRPKAAGQEPDALGQTPLGKSPLGIGLRVGLELVAALLVAVAIGYGLDLLFGTQPILMVAFIPLGGAAGVLNVYRLMAPRPRDGSKTGDA